MPDLIADAAAASSPADRLPEVGSLPDGFVESPDADNAAVAADYEELPAEPTSGEEGIGSAQVGPWPLVEVEEGNDGVKGSSEAIRHSVLADAEVPMPKCRPLVEVEAGSDGVKGSSEAIRHSVLADAEVQVGDLKEEGHADGKDSSSEVKRKSTKRTSKAEKELLDLTLKYQQVVAERDGAIAVREKLESLCRELQRQNKMLMDDCKRVSTDSQNLRLELSTKFHDAIKDVSHKLEEQKDECLLQLKENEMLRNKLKHLSDQYAISEQQFQQKVKQKMLELQLSDLKLKQHEDKSAKEQAQMKLYAEQVSVLLETEKNLRMQLAADGERFQQFQEALVKSNEVFETFKQEMEKMAKSMKELKKENDFLKSKCEKTDVSLIELVEEREYLKKQLDKVKGQKEKLESLCRLLQAERKQQLSGESNACGVPT